MVDLPYDSFLRDLWKLKRLKLIPWNIIEENSKYGFRLNEKGATSNSQ